MMKFRNPFFQQYLLEILLPLIGYFFFDWSLTIIAVFFLLDQFVSEFSFIRKFKAISKSQNTKFIFLSAISLFATGGIIILESVFVFKLISQQGHIEFGSTESELITFAKEELWLLFPLMLLIYYLKDQFTFFMPRKFLMKNAFKFFWTHICENALIAILVISGSTLLLIFDVQQLFILIAFLVLKIGFDLSVAKKLESISSKV